MKTLVIRLSSIGDILLTTPVVRCLKKKYPDATIDFCVFKEYADILRGNPYISNIIPVDRSLPIAKAKEQIKSNEIYDCVVDLHNNFRSRTLRNGVAKKVFVVNKRTSQRWLLVKTKIDLLRNAPDVMGRYFETVAPLNATDDGEGIDFFAEISSEKKKDMIDGFDTSEKFIVALCPGAKHYTKRWLPGRFVELAHTLIRDKKASIILFGGKDDANICAEIYAQVHTDFPERVINACGKCSLSEVAGLMQLCDCVVTNDSGLMHVAASQKKPLVAIFGSTVKEFGFAPTSPHSIVVENKELDCRPCTHIGRDSCPKGHFRCMADITTEQVKAAIDSVTV